MKKRVFAIVAVLCLLLLSGFAAGRFGSYATPEKCVRSTALMLHPLASSRVGDIHRELARVSLGETLLFVYENEGQDVMIAELRQKTAGEKTRYTYQELTVYRAGQYDEPAFSMIKNTTRDGNYTYGVYPKGYAGLREEGAGVRLEPFEVNEKDYVLEILSTAE